MSLLSRFTDGCIRSAARRWPADLAEPLILEWRAELDHARRDPDLSHAARTRQQLAFALSLACSPTAGSESPITPRKRAAILGLIGGRLVTLLGVGVLAYLGPAMAFETWDLTMQQSPEPSIPAWVSTAVTVVGTLLTTAAMARLGSVVGRRMPVEPGRSGSTGFALRAVLPLCGGYLIAFLVAARGNHGQNWNGPEDIVAIAVWTVFAVVMTAAAIRLAHAGRIRTARMAAAIGFFVAVDVAGILAALPTVLRNHLSMATAPLWLPVSTGVVGYARYGDGSAIDDATALLYPTVVPLLLVAAFLTTYAIRRPPDTAEAEADDQTVSSPDSWGSVAVRTYAIGTATFGLGLWTFLLAFATASFSSPFLTPPILADGRIIAIALVLFAFVIYNAGRGPVAAPTGIAATGLLVADHLAGNHAWRGPVAAVLLAVIGVSAVAGASWLTPRLAGPGTTDTSARRALITVAVIAAFGIPTTIEPAIASAYGTSGHDVWISHPALWMKPTAPVALLVLACSALMMITTVLAALASRRERLSAPRTSLVALVVVGLYLAGTVSPSLLHYRSIHFYVQPVIAIVVVAAARRPDAGYRRHAAAVICAVAVGAGAASVLLVGPLSGVQEIVSGVFPAVLAEFSTTDPVPLLLLGTALALVLAPRLTPPRDSNAAGPDKIPVTPAPAPA